jgi:hypothetical protein
MPLKEELRPLRMNSPAGDLLTHLGVAEAKRVGQHRVQAWVNTGTRQCTALLNLLQRPAYVLVLHLDTSRWPTRGRPWT